MSNNAISEILDGLEWEKKYVQSTSGTQRREVKLKRGDSWLLRFLPAQIGPKKRFYVRIAKHWHNKRAIVCPRHTEEALGGDPNAYCPVCDLADALNADKNQDISKAGYALRGTANWTTYCVVFEKHSNGVEEVMPGPEVLQPYTFNHYKSTWEELTGFINAGLRRSPLSVLDYEKGNDFFVSRGAKSTRLDKQDSAPIFPLETEKDAKIFDENIAKIEALCKDPVIKVPTDSQLDEFCVKAEEDSLNAGRGGARRAAPRTYDEDDLPPEDAAPSPRRRAVVEESAAPARRTASAPAPAPARTTVSRSTVAARRPEPEPEPEPGDAGDSGDYGSDGYGDDNSHNGEGDAEDAGDAAGDAAEPAEEPTPVVSTRPSARPSARASVSAQAEAPARRTAAPPPAQSNRASSNRAPARSSGAPVRESLDDDENIPEESKDQAPPVPLVEGDSGAETEPPPVSRRGSFGAAIREKIRAVDSSAKR